MAPLRILHLNSLLKGGGTDDRSIRIAHALMQLGYATWVAGPAGREFTATVEQLKIPFCPVPAGGPLQLPLILLTASVIRCQRIQILHARHGRDYWPAILAAHLSRRRPKVVLSRHLAKSPSSWGSRRFLLSQCDALVAVSHFVAIRDLVEAAGYKTACTTDPGVNAAETSPYELKRFTARYPSRSLKALWARWEFFSWSPSWRGVKRKPLTSQGQRSQSSDPNHSKRQPGFIWNTWFPALTHRRARDHSFRMVFTGLCAVCLSIKRWNAVGKPPAVPDQKQAETPIKPWFAPIAQMDRAAVS